MCSSVFRPFIVYATWAAFQDAHYTSARISRRSTRRRCWATRRTPGSARSRRGGRRWLPFSPALLILPFPGLLPLHLLLLPRRLLQGVLGRSAVVRGRRAAQELLGRALVPADPAERPPLLHVHRGASSSCCSPTTSGRRCGSPIRRPAATSSASASARIVLAVNVVLLSSYTFGCHSLRHLVGGAHRRDLEVADLRQACYDCVELPQLDATCCGPGAACSRSASPTSTSGSARWAIWHDLRIF